MFVSHETVLPVSFLQARAGLIALARGGWFREVSGRAYEDGLGGLLRVGPFGDLVGVSKLVRVSLLEPVPRDDAMVLPLRWEATGPAGRLLPVLDANLVLAPEGACTTRLTFSGAYRPPLAALGKAIDRMVLHSVATATVRSLMKQVTETVIAEARPPPAAEGREARGEDLAGEGCGPGLPAG